ncbi:MAG: DUF3226 domain-containing protein [Romboutsia sp.]
MNHYLFIVEGAHDVSLVSSILRVLKFRCIKDITHIIPPFNNLLMDRFPLEKNSLDLYNKIPTFYAKENKNICIISADGEMKLIKALDNAISKFRLEELDDLTKVIIFCDGDLKNREDKISELIRLSFPKGNDLEINKEKLRDGFLSLKYVEIINIEMEFFVMPNNKDSGRLEQILIEAIKLVDKELLEDVDIFLSNVPKEYKTKWSESNSKFDKTRISCVGNVKNPASSMGSLIGSSKWITSDTVKNCKLLGGIYKYIENVVR